MTFDVIELYLESRSLHSAGSQINGHAGSMQLPEPTVSCNVLMSSTSILSRDRSIRLEAKSTVMLEACRSHNLLWVLTFIVIDLDLESRSLHSAGSQIHGQAWRLAAV